jgi:hypothetical protein
LETRRGLLIAAPSNQVFNSVALAEIPKNYSLLYFKINKYNSFENTTSVVYTSETKEGVTVENTSQTVWDLTGNPFEFPLLDLSFENFASYEIEFFTENNQSVTRFDPFFNNNILDDIDEFIAGEQELSTTRSDCADCDSIKIIVDIAFTN